MKFSDSDLSIICCSLLPQTSSCLKFCYKRACQVSYQKGFKFSQETKLHKCLSFRAHYISHKRQPDNVYSRKFVVTLHQVLCTAILNLILLIIGSVDVFITICTKSPSDYCFVDRLLRYIILRPHCMHHIW